MVQFGLIVTSVITRMYNFQCDYLFTFSLYFFFIQGDTKYDDQDESPRATRVDHIAKVQLLENELAQAMEANNKFKIQLHRCV